MNSTGAEVTKNDGGGEGKKFAVANAYAVKLTTGCEFNGMVLAYDANSNIVIFEEGTKPRPGNLKDIRTVNANFITESKYLGKVKDTLAAKKHMVDLTALQEKERLSIREIERKDVVVSITKEAKSIFEALSKALPVEWENSDILAMGDVRISSPYTSDCVTGGAKPANNRVKRTLNTVRKELFDERLMQASSK